MCLGTCDILNGGCGEICIPEENGRRCECDVGLQLQTDQSCDRGLYANLGFLRKRTWIIYLYILINQKRIEHKYCVASETQSKHSSYVNRVLSGIFFYKKCKMRK